MYTRGLWDMGDTCLVPPGSGMETPGGFPAPSGDGGDEGAGLEPFRVAKRSPRRDVGPQPSPGSATPPWGQSCPHPSRHSLDVTVVEGAIVVHLQRESLSTWMQGTRNSPTATTKSRSQVGLEHP